MSRTNLCDSCIYILSNFKKVCKECSFLKCYIDRYGTIYFVRPGINHPGFKTYFIRPGDKKHYAYERLSFQFSFAEAQSNLNSIAKERKWKVYNGVSPAEWSAVV